MEANDVIKIPRGLTEEIERGPYPTHRLKRVKVPTTYVGSQIERFDERETGFNRALRGDFGPRAQKERVRFTKKTPISAALGQMLEYLIPVVDGPLAQEKAPIPQDPKILSRHMKALAYFLKADMVGICRLPPYAVYSHDKDGNPIHLNHQNAIAILIDQDFTTFNGSTGYDWISNTNSFHSYSLAGFIAVNMANYIRRLGYPARAHHGRSYQVVVPPILLWAGMGEMCRMGTMVLNPFLGPRFKASVVTTDLPLEPDLPIDIGVQDYCDRCQKCSRECPSKAIPQGGKVIYNDYELWRLDVEACTKFRLLNSKGASCGRCIKVCPWNKPYTGYHKPIEVAVEHSRLARRMTLFFDDLLGYGKPKPKDKWWFDLEEQEGVLRIPDDSAKDGS